MSRQPGRNCGGCRYWSEMIARAGGAADNSKGEPEALCLNAASIYSSTYTTGLMVCVDYAPNRHGTIDQGESIRAIYELEKRAASKPPIHPALAKEIRVKAKELFLSIDKMASTPASQITILNIATAAVICKAVDHEALRTLMGDASGECIQDALDVISEVGIEEFFKIEGEAK